MNALRATLRATYGARNYRIHSDGRVMAYGPSEQTSVRRWHLRGTIRPDGLVTPAHEGQRFL